MVALLNSKEAYNHFRPQSGGGFFRGNLRQRGRGIGGILSSIARTALPIFKKHILPQVGKTLLATASDIASGKNIKQSVKKRTKKAGKQILRNLINKPPTKKRLTKRRPKYKKTPKDIFS